MKAFSLVLLVTLMLGCGSNKNKNAENQNEMASKPAQVEFQTISQGNLYGSGKEQIPEQQIVIKDAEQWNSLIEKMNSVNDMTSNFKETDIDFSKYSVLAVFEKVLGHGGSSIKVANITENEDQIQVFVKKTSPDGMSTSVMTQPYHLVKIPATEKEVVFE